MRILLVHNYYRSGAPGGEDIVFEQERDLLIKSGHEVRCYTRSNDEVDETSFLQKAKAVRSLVWSDQAHSELRSLISEFRPNVAHFHNIFPLITASAYEACQDAGVAVIQTIHNFRMVCSSATLYREGSACNECGPGRRWPAVLHRCYRGSLFGSMAVARMLSSYESSRAYDFIDQFLVLSAFAKNKLTEFGIDSERVAIKPNFVLDVNVVRDPNPEYVLFAGRWAEEKGVRLLVEAWRQMGSCRLVMIGDGPLRPWIESEVARHRLSVDLVGNVPRDRVAGFLSGARCLIAPSICQEAGIPLVVIEAWQSRVPVIASSAGSLAEAVEQGLVLGFDASSADDLVRKIHQLIQNPRFYDELSDAGRSRYERDHTAEQSITMLQNLYLRHSAKALTA